MNETRQTGGAWLGWTRRHRLVLSVLGHGALFVCAWFLAFGLAYNFKGSPTLARPVYWLLSFFVKTTPPSVYAADWLTDFFLPLLAPVLVIKISVFVLAGLHRQSWRYVSLRDVFAVARAAWWSFVGIFVLYYGLQNAQGLGQHVGLDLSIQPFGDKFPDSVFLLDFAGTIALVCGARLAVRLYHEEIRPSIDGPAPKLLIVGAGNAGENVVREIQRMPVERYRVVGFLDDDESKWGAQIHGVEVLGTIANVKKICAEHDVDEILIAIPSARRERLRKVVELCQGTNLRFKTLPALEDLIAGRASVKEIRDVDINDVLGRAPVRLDEGEIESFIRGRVVMVTGAGGSIGSEMCRQIARFRPAGLILIERAEPALFAIDQELRRQFPNLAIS
ncbi:MAG: polysaccharide biosynthesis protein, partial [Planctomycetota bacterium]